MIDIQKVETFLAAAENLSLSEAAKHLHLSQPAVSHHIKVLEQDSLMNDLKEFGLQPELIDIRIIYRALRNLEAEGLISDSWDENSLGPQRRVYTITPQGEAALAEWIQNLRQRRKEIETLEAAYDAVKKSSEF